MSLEQALAENTAALKALTAAMGGKASTKSAADAAIEAEATRAAKAGAGKSTKTKGPTIDDIKARFGAYLGIEDKKERALRVVNVKKICAKFNAEAISKADQSDWPEALELLTKFEEGEDPFAEDDDEGGSNSMI
jgi:hypothetical protein